MSATMKKPTTTTSQTVPPTVSETVPEVPAATDYPVDTLYSVMEAMKVAGIALRGAAASEDPARPWGGVRALAGHPP